MDGNPVLERMADHRTVRQFQPVAVDPERLAAAVAAAQMASTSSHGQAYCALHVTDPNRRARLAELCGNQAHVATAGAFLVLCGDLRRHQLLAERAGQPCAQNLESFLVAVIDAALFAQNLSLACESMGLGICYIGSLRNHLPEVDALLDLPEGVLPLFGLCVGEPASRPGRKPRLPLPAVLFEDADPDDATLLAEVDAYDAAMAAYYEARGAPGRDWSRGVVERNAVARRADVADYYRLKGAVLE